MANFCFATLVIAYFFTLINRSIAESQPSDWDDDDKDDDPGKKI